MSSGTEDFDALKQISREKMADMSSFESTRDADDRLQASESADQLQWLALQYVLGELPDSELAPFESRLSDDLAAQNAVADAMLLTCGVRAALQSPCAAQAAVSDSVTAVAPPLRNASSRRRSRLGLALSAAAMLMTAVAITLPGTEQTLVSGLNDIEDARDPIDPQVSAVERELVHRWRDGQRGLTPSGPIEPNFVSDEDAEELEAVPEWLIAAVSLEAHGGSADDSVPQDN